MPSVRLLLGAVLIVVAACGGGAMSLTEYAGEVEFLVGEVGSRLDRLDAERSSQPLTVGREQLYWRGRVDARTDFLESFRALDPPDEVAVLHSSALDLLEQVTTAEQVIAARAAAMEMPGDIESLWNGPEVAAWEALDDQTVELCMAAQADLNRTEERAPFRDSLWVPPQLKEIVSVAFGCTPEQRGAEG